MASELLQLQWKFTRMVPKLIAQAHALGYEATLGDGFRDPRLHGDFGVKRGYGAAKSQHKRRLAIDLLLFKDGKYLTDTKDYAPLGLWWEQQGGAWGGRFEDGNHFSLEYQGAK